MADSRDVVHTRSGATLHLGPEVVEKVHRAGTDPDALRRRLRPRGARPLSVVITRIGTGAAGRATAFVCRPSR